MDSGRLRGFIILIWSDRRIVYARRALCIFCVLCFVFRGSWFAFCVSCFAFCVSRKFFIFFGAILVCLILSSIVFLLFLCKFFWHNFASL